MTVTALIVAAGTGERLGGGMPKQYRAARRQAGAALGRGVADPSSGHAIGAGGGRRGPAGAGRGGARRPRRRRVDRGGAERADSVRAGLAAIDGDAVLVHDAARPFCPPDVIDRLRRQPRILRRRRAGPSGRRHAGAGRRPPRTSRSTATGLVRVQTPQAFRLDALRQAYASWSGAAADRRDDRPSRAPAWTSPPSKAIPRSTSSPPPPTSTAPSNGSPVD